MDKKGRQKTGKVGYKKERTKSQRRDQLRELQNMGGDSCTLLREKEKIVPWSGLQSMEPNRLTTSR